MFLLHTSTSSGQYLLRNNASGNCPEVTRRIRYSCINRPHRQMFLFKYISCRQCLLIVLLLSIYVYYVSFSQTKTTRSFNQTMSSIQILFAVRTSSGFYRNRLVYLLQTWTLLVKDHVYFITDKILPNISRTHMILTEETCGSDAHSMNSLCCKTAHDFIAFNRYVSKYDWFCHFDDDQYVNVYRLKEYLATLDSDEPYYIGRSSWSDTVKRTKEPFQRPFWFATLGAGLCLSKRTIHLLAPYTQTVSQFVDGCVNENYHDDIYLGFLLNGYLNITLTKNQHFHSHLEKSLYNSKLTFIRTFMSEITFGFRLPDRYPHFLPQLYPSHMDPYRMRSLHCLLFTQTKECETRIRQHLFNSTK